MNKITSKFWAFGIIFMLMISVNSVRINAQDAQWRGPNRDGLFTDTSLLKEWPKEGPEILFVTEGLGRGFSSTVATKDMIYATGKKDSTEYLTAMDHSGKILWQKPYGLCWNKSFPEARCTPTVEGDRVYVLSGMDKMTCFNSKTGNEIWSVDIHEEYNSSWDMFGVSESVLIVDDMILTSPAGKSTTVIALDKMNGGLIWKSEPMDSHRCNMAPMAIKHCGKKYFITGTQTHLIGVDVENGDILWTYHYNFLSPNGDNTTILTNTPIYKDSCLWISNGWDVKSVMLEIAPDGKSVSEKFVDQTFDNQNHGLVLVDGFLYGSNFTGRNSGKWVCMNWSTGEITWIADFHNKGPILSAEGMLYCLEEKRGNIALVKADPKEFKVISTFRIKEGKGPYWARPAIYEGKLLVRHGDVMIGYDIVNYAKAG
ncbi:MAG: PQQ-binding-like beta-propeller repeat protein [Bacteroidetes bacterium]|nr:PQQ-binding-like beta-propeller repeat protein [Bacteroidota bacterium]MBT3750457.1 PQQ-binding-like beta-propeller repeat protein [Bacteroidota bacterium]MBT4399188.1 PQQ-binding-like beta-propeller repeat protein [Bacteroidota bacterium]MBT4411499.1 PQQ-binding-like beta-propeller repeat protein [Bacteroidota bacterium]MBT5427563.1 PQQ-binding-like beta-propeller repeat protein [Bacteroidota bacterium]